MYYVTDFVCPLRQVKCKDNIQCMHTSSLCDGFITCNDRSDEAEETCKGKRTNIITKTVCIKLKIIKVIFISLFSELYG